MSDGTVLERKGRNKKDKGEPVAEYPHLLVLAVADFEDDGYTWWYAVPKNQKLQRDKWKRCTCRPLEELSRPPSDPGHPDIEGDVKWYRRGTAEYDVFPNAVFGEVTLLGIPDPSSDPSAGKQIWALSVFAHRDMEVLYQAFLAREAADKQRTLEQRTALPSQPEEKQPGQTKAAVEVEPIQELVDISPLRVVEVAPGTAFVVSTWPTLPHLVAPLVGHRAVELRLPAEVTTERLFAVPDHSSPIPLPSVPCQRFAVGSIVWESKWEMPAQDGAVRVVQCSDLRAPENDEKNVALPASRTTKRKRSDEVATAAVLPSLVATREAKAALPPKSATTNRAGSRAGPRVEAFRIGDNYYSAASPLGPTSCVSELHGKTVSGQGHSTAVIGDEGIVVTTEGQPTEDVASNDGSDGDQSCDSDASNSQAVHEDRGGAKNPTTSQAASSVPTQKEPRRGGGVTPSQSSGSDAVMMDLLRCVEEVKKHCP